MRIKTSTTLSIILVLLATLFLPLTSAVADSGAWEWLAPGVMVKFKTVVQKWDNGDHLYTWTIKNNGGSTLRTLEFVVTARHADGTYTAASDGLRGPLKPGESVGGWSTYTQSSDVTPSIKITEIERD